MSANVERIKVDGRHNREDRSLWMSLGTIWS
jgi:hypothetical protein